MDVAECDGQEGFQMVEAFQVLEDVKELVTRPIEEF
jgi:hypothetical protein